MFYVINKEKLIAYCVSVFTIVILFIVAGIMKPKNNNIEQTEDYKKQISIYDGKKLNEKS